MAPLHLCLRVNNEDALFWVLSMGGNSSGDKVWIPDWDLLPLSS